MIPGSLRRMAICTYCKTKQHATHFYFLNSLITFSPLPFYQQFAFWLHDSILSPSSTPSLIPAMDMWVFLSRLGGEGRGGEGRGEVLIPHLTLMGGSTPKTSLCTTPPPARGGRKCIDIPPCTFQSFCEHHKFHLFYSLTPWRFGGLCSIYLAPVLRLLVGAGFFEGSLVECAFGWGFEEVGLFLGYGWGFVGVGTFFRGGGGGG